MSRMIDDVLDLARARLAGGIPINRAPADLRTLINRVVQEHRGASPQAIIEVACEGNVTGEWDADRRPSFRASCFRHCGGQGEATDPCEHDASDCTGNDPTPSSPRT